MADSRKGEDDFVLLVHQITKVAKTHHKPGHKNVPIFVRAGFEWKQGAIATRTITKNRFVSVRSHDTPRTESDKHCDQNKANV